MSEEVLFFVTRHDCGNNETMSFDIKVNPQHPEAWNLGVKGIVALINQAGSSISKDRLSPLTVQMMLEAHYKPNGEWPNKSSMQHIESCRWIVDNGYVDIDNEGHKMTGRGKLWISKITQSPENLS